ncbi:hypothetical protein E5K00_03425 [Hymenobacter aquaticus]|uniref:Uncharacterized protein n=1 Tax=Hymenobacter aquaticus TaxID=1867101 RepID=A0A4Z0Q2G1_9BACT|nr:hypothetical protein [Hymenobacter aquaticus]TGE24278.1 hypothetical protein E5K00_03425 [Hymenobacter aquaticus]
MLDFLGEMVLQGLFSALLRVLAWLIRMIFYWPILGVGWLCLWWPQRAQVGGLGKIWKQHPLAAMHQAGWRATVVVMQYSIAVLLPLPLVALLVWLVVYYATR